jgi:ribosomal subunit interface protein
MEIPLQITFHDVKRSDAIEANIRARVANLEKFCDSIIGCSVAVESPHHHHAKGRHFLIRVEVTVPGDKLVANREPDAHHAYTDVYVAIRDAFDTIRRQLEDYERRRRRQVKAHEVPHHGRVIELNLEDGYGRIETPEGRLVYFNGASLVSAGFDALEIGTEVRFDEEMGDRGPQATSVHIIGKHHIVG